MATSLEPYTEGDHHVIGGLIVAICGIPSGYMKILSIAWGCKPHAIVLLPYRQFEYQYTYSLEIFSDIQSEYDF